MARVDHEHGPRRQGQAALVADFVWVEHSELSGQLAALVGDDRVRERIALGHSGVVFYVLRTKFLLKKFIVTIISFYLNPSSVGIGRVDGQGDHFDVPLLELWLQSRHPGQLGGAHGGEVGRVREQNAPPETKGFSGFSFTLSQTIMYLVKTYESLDQSQNLILPSLVSASKLGNTSPSFILVGGFFSFGFAMFKAIYFQLQPAPSPSCRQQVVQVVVKNAAWQRCSHFLRVRGWDLEV